MKDKQPELSIGTWVSIWDAYGVQVIDYYRDGNQTFYVGVDKNSKEHVFTMSEVDCVLEV